MRLDFNTYGNLYDQDSRAGRLRSGFLIWTDLLSTEHHIINAKE